MGGLFFLFLTVKFQELDSFGWTNLKTWIKIKNMKRRRKVIVISGLLVVVVAALAGTWYFYRPQKVDNPTVVIKDNLPPVPANFSDLVIDEKELGEITPQARQKLIDEFNEIVGKIREIPESIAYWTYLGTQKKIFGDYRGATDAWEYALKLNGDAVTPRTNLANLYHYFIKDYPKAEEEYLRFLQQHPERVDIYANLSALYKNAYKQKSYLADDVLKQGLEVNPYSTDLMSLLGDYYLSEGNYKEALKYYQQLEKLGALNQSGLEDLEFLRQQLSR